MISRTSSDSSSPAQGRIGTVYLVTPGGTTAKGGIGRMVDYLHRTWNQPHIPMVVIDTYGPGQQWKMPFYYAVCVLRLLIDLALGKVGLLHIHMSERLSVLRKGLLVHLGKAFCIPVVLHLHGADFADYCHSLTPQKLARVKRMMGKADAVITLGNYWRDFVKNELGVREDRVTVLHNAVPGPADQPQQSSNSSCRLLFLGVVCERKGVPTLLSALARPELASLNWKIVFAGNGEVETYRSEAARLGLSDKTEFTGWIDEARAKTLLAQTDVLVLPSRNEGLPMAILEGMSYGLPIVSTPVGSIRDAVTSEDNGILVPVGDSVRLADALRRLVEDPALRDRMGRASKVRHREMFDITAFNRKLLDIYTRAKQNLPVPDAAADIGATVLPKAGNGVR